MTDDQHRIGALTDSRLAVTGCLERWDATTGPDRPDPIAVADWLLEQLRNLGWRPPLDLTEKPALRPDNPAPADSPGRKQLAAVRAALALPHSDACTPELRADDTYAADCRRCTALAAHDALAARRKDHH